MDTTTFFTLNTLLAVGLGVGLSAAVGFRIFVPFTVMSMAAMAGYLDPSPGFEWVATVPALIVFITATLLEIGAYYVPWLDNLLDTVAVPAAVVAGAVITASVVGDISPMLRWVLAIIAGGGVAGVVQTGTTLLRGASTLTTGGLANPAVNTAEIAGSLSLAVVTILVPVLALAIVIVLLVLVVRRLVRRRNRTQRLTAGDGSA